MADTKDEFQDPVFHFGDRFRQMTQPEESRFVAQERLITAQLERLSEFVATRAALEDAADYTAEIQKPRVAAIGLHIGGTRMKLSFLGKS
jgi:hypothetical protein